MTEHDDQAIEGTDGKRGLYPLNVSFGGFIPPLGDEKIILTARGETPEELRANIQAVITVVMQELTQYGYEFVLDRKVRQAAQEEENVQQRTEDFQRPTTPPSQRSAPRGRDNFPQDGPGQEVTDADGLAGWFQVGRVVTDMNRAKTHVIAIITRASDPMGGRKIWVGFPEAESKAQKFPKHPAFAVEKFELDGRVLFDSRDPGMPPMRCFWSKKKTDDQFANCEGVEFYEPDTLGHDPDPNPYHERGALPF